MAGTDQSVLSHRDLSHVLHMEMSGRKMCRAGKCQQALSIYVCEKHEFVGKCQEVGRLAAELTDDLQSYKVIGLEILFHSNATAIVKTRACVRVCVCLRVYVNSNCSLIYIKDDGRTHRSFTHSFDRLLFPVVPCLQKWLREFLLGHICFLNFKCQVTCGISLIHYR